MKPFEYCVFIGRFQPFHNGHYELLKTALSKADTVLIILGSHKKAPDIENPFSSAQREEIIRAALTSEEEKRVKFLRVRDSWYVHNKWLTDVQQQVFEATEGCDDDKICIIGAETYFPQWKFFQQQDIEHMPHATTIRDMYFTHDVGYKSHVHQNVASYLENFVNTVSFADLKASYKYIMEYRAAWTPPRVPYPVIFTTVDSVVIKSGHVLVVRRKGFPGRGQIALPGGFLNQDETITAGYLRELKEETKIKLDKKTLESSTIASKVFDYPKRSLRGRTITHAYLIDLGSGSLPIVQGDDDADKAWWMSLSEFATREEEFFEDHFHIISHFVNKF
jgi:bifunctional NMN adenylyltransferase/nudix hydrolase